MLDAWGGGAKCIINMRTVGEIFVQVAQKFKKLALYNGFLTIFIFNGYNYNQEYKKGEK